MLQRCPKQRLPMTSELVDLWRKDGQRGEMIIYELLGRHPRIVTYHGHDPVNFELLLQHHPKGDLNRYLQQHPEVPFQNRVAWAVEIAQGIAYLHSKEVVWNDMHFGNVLITDDLHVVLCDFGGSYLKPKPCYSFEIGPPLPYVCPDSYYGWTNKRQDIFAFGVMLFVILSKRYPHCPTSSFTPSINELEKIFDLHQDRKFDALPDAIYPHFAQIIDNCFSISYESGAELLLDLKEAYSSWTKNFEKARFLFIILYQLSSLLGNYRAMSKILMWLVYRFLMMHFMLHVHRLCATFDLFKTLRHTSRSCLI